MLEEIIENYGCYVLLVLLGVLFRYAQLRYVIYDKPQKVKRVVGEIGVVIFITIIFSEFGGRDTDTSTAVAVGVLFVGYCIFMFAKKLPSCGYTESLLLVVNGFMVTGLSFVSFPKNLLFSAVIIIISWVAVKYWFGEKRSDFWEIVLLCGEALLISVYMYLKDVSEPMEIARIVLFVETFVYTLNCGLKYVLVWLCGEDTEDYWDKLMGLE